MKRELGQAFVLVLILLAVGGLLIVPFLQIVSTTVKSRQMYGQFINEDYAADAAIEYGMWRLKYEPGFAASLPPGQESEPFYVTLNGVTASTTVIAQAPPGQLSGQDLAGRAWDEPFKVTKTVIATSTYATLAADGFESGDGSHGTGSWLGNWTLLGYHSFNYGGAPEGSRYLWLYGDTDENPGDGYAERQVDLSGSSGEGPFLCFYARVDSFEGYHDDEAYVKVSTDGHNWDVLKTFTSTDNDYQYHHYQYDLSSYGTPSTFYVAFETHLNGDHDYFYIDDVKFINSQETTVVEPGVDTVFTYYVSIQCYDPDGCCYQDWWTNLGLDNIVDILPERGASSDYLRYVGGSTDWDEDEWGVPPFDPTAYSSGWGSDQHQELKWDFEDKGYNDVCFDYGEIKTMSFRARAALEEGVYCNSIQVYISSYWGWGWQDDLVAGTTAKITVGDPAETNCSGGLLTIEKVADPIIIFPNEPTTVTYTITIQNVDTIPVRIYQIEDWLPSTGSDDYDGDSVFRYVDDSTYGYIIGRDSLPILFHDNFSRPDSYTVSYWVEDEIDSADCRIYQGDACLKYDGSITQADISTIGNFGNVLSYQWRGKTTESTDTLRVEWKPSSSSEWNTLAEHPLDYTSAWQNASYDLPAGADDTSIDIRFTGITDQANEYARLDNVKVSCSNPADITPVCMPDESEGWGWDDFFYQEWHWDSQRWELDWDFNYYPDEDDPVWSIGGVCAGYPYADYSPYLELQPGEIFEIVFQATVTLSASGSYYDEVFVRISSEGWGWWDNWLYSWPTGGVTVPQYDLQAETLHSVLRAAAMLSPDGFWWRSWHWWRHR